MRKTYAEDANLGTENYEDTNIMRTQNCDTVTYIVLHIYTHTYTYIYTI